MADSRTIISNTCNDETSESINLHLPSTTPLVEHREKVKEPTPPRSIPSLLEKVLPSHSTLPKENNNSTSSNRSSFKRKSATLAITPSAGNNNTNHDSNSSNSSSTSSNGHQFSRSGTFRRSFTLPRSLLLRKSGQTGPVSGNNGNFVRNIFLTFVKSRNSTRKKKETTENGDSDSACTIQDTTDSIPLPTLGLPPGFVPAAVGLKNQGNTCFMNAIVQCLSHTDVLAKYLVTDAYKSDLRRKYWIKNGKGEVTEELAAILKSTWFRMNSSVLEETASKFKSAVERGASQWRGSEQHDAQEFLLWLLDRLHEDLNQAASNKYKPVKNNFGRPDEQVAAEALANHVRCNNSIIHEIFGAQFRSSLTCPGCGRQSATFDPFLCVSLPIPEGKQEVPVYINILYLSQQPRLVKLGLSISASADIKELKQLISADTEISENQILLAEIDGEGFHRTFTETQLVSVLSSNEALYCIETPEPKEISETDGAFLMVTWTNILISNDGSTRVRFGSPYITQVSREIGYMDLQKILLKEMAAIVQVGVLIADQKEPVFSIRILDGTSEGCLIDPGVEHPLYMEAIDHALCLCDEDVPTHIKVQLEWSNERKDKLIADDLETIEEHSSVGQVRQRYSEEPVSTVTLGECFDLYTKAEQLSAEDSWHCPHCNRKEQGTLKMIGLWTAPQILVVHLKRFRQVTKLRHAVTKISSVVEFPVEGLDLGHYVSKRNRAAHHLDASNLSLNQTSPINGCFSLGSWKQRASFKKHLANSTNAAQAYSRGINGYHNGTNGTVIEDSGMIYDLFAVCNHHGKDLQGGHYTAYCKNPVDNSWWLFDDTRVNQLDSSADVNTASAYILFYQRRSLSGGPHLNNANNITNHWCRNLLKKHVRAYNPVNGTESTHNRSAITANGHDKESEESEQKSGQGAPLARMEDEHEDCTSNNNASFKKSLTNGISSSPHQPHELQIESTV